jgi:hypothetical protein
MGKGAKRSSARDEIPTCWVWCELRGWVGTPCRNMYLLAVGITHSGPRGVSCKEAGMEMEAGCGG